MNFITPTRFLSIAALVCGLSLSAHAQATRTWVSGTGDDANPCSRTAPCKTFAGAISKTAASGEINVIDPGGYGAVTINKALTIRSQVEAGVLVAGTNAIVVNAGATDKVVLDGLDIEGLGATSTSLNGVKINSGQVVYVLHCNIRGFHNGNGVDMTSSTAGARVFIQNSLIENCLGGVHVQGNGATNIASVVDTTIDSNQNFSLQLASGNVIGLARSVLNNSPAAISNSGGTVVSIGPSNIISGTGSPNTTVPFN